MEGLPFGTFSYALTAEAICRACALKDEVDTEVWGGYFLETGKFHCGLLEIEDRNVKWPDLRLTVDTSEDYEFVKRIFEVLGERGEFSLQQIIKLCRDRPELVEINSEIVQKKGLAIRVREE